MTSKVIIVSSKNPVKITATRQGFSALLPAPYTIQPLSVPSGVPEQPFSDQETLQGALNRVANARRETPEADFWVGIEGGVHDHDGAILNFAWIVVQGRSGKVGKARTASYYLPEESADLVRGGDGAGACG